MSIEVNRRQTRVPSKSVWCNRKWTGDRFVWPKSVTWKLLVSLLSLLRSTFSHQRETESRRPLSSPDACNFLLKFHTPTTGFCSRALHNSRLPCSRIKVAAIDSCETKRMKYRFGLFLFRQSFVPSGITALRRQFDPTRFHSLAALVTLLLHFSVMQTMPTRTWIDALLAAVILFFFFFPFSFFFFLWRWTRTLFSYKWD